MFETIKFIFQLIPVILELVKSIENQIPEGGQGKEKLEFIKSILNALSEAYPSILNVSSIIEKIVSYSVSLYNTTGVFKK